MRTRSQPLSPTGFQALGDEPRPRRPRTTHASSQPAETEAGPSQQAAPKSAPKTTRKTRGKKAARGRKKNSTRETRTESPEAGAEQQHAEVPEENYPQNVIEENHPQNVIEQNRPQNVIEQNRPQNVIEQNRPETWNVIDENYQNVIEANHPNGPIESVAMQSAQIQNVEMPNVEETQDPQAEAEQQTVENVIAVSSSENETFVSAPEHQPSTPQPKPTRRSSSTKSSRRSTLSKEPKEKRTRHSSYADIARRRRAEAGGRIDRTLYRIPEWLSQNDSVVPNSSSNPSRVVGAEQTPPPALNANAPPATAPAAAEGWGRWIFNNASRKWTEIFGARAAGNAPPGENAQPFAEPTAPSSWDSYPGANGYLGAETSSDTSAVYVTAPTQNRSGSKPTYDLFPRPYPQELVDKWSMRDRKPAAVSPTPATDSVTETAPPDADQSRKRKRRPSGDAIPNPPGCSYGLDTDYFYYDSDDEAWEAEELERRVALVKEAETKARERAMENAESARPAPKKVRIQEPPKHQPGRPGRTFQTPYSSSSSSDQARRPRPSSAPGPTTPQQPGLGRPGRTFQTPYSSSSSEESGLHAVAEEIETTPSAPTINVQSEASPAPAPVAEATETPEASPAPAPESDTELAEPKDPSPLTRARNEAEKFKPKMPSRLRAAHRFSSSMIQDPSTVNNTTYVSDSTNISDPMSIDPSSIGDPMSICSYDSALEDANWLYQICPSGDFSQIQFPEPRPLWQALDVDPRAAELCDQEWEDKYQKHAEDFILAFEKRFQKCQRSARERRAQAQLSA